jgi:hypothetical protein
VLPVRPVGIALSGNKSEVLEMVMARSSRGSRESSRSLRCVFVVQAIAVVGRVLACWGVSS